jgi:hypothetical protein
MSSAISTDDQRRATNDQRLTTNDQGLQPWQFFVLAALGCATAVTFIARGRDVTSIILLSVLMASCAVVGMAALRALRPLVSAEDDRTAMVGQRTRAALEREKLLTLRAIKELEFDKAMGKLSDEDFREMAGRLRARAAGLIRQLDAGSGYRAQIEADLQKRLGNAPGSGVTPGPKDPAYVDRAADRRAGPLDPPVSAPDRRAGPLDPPVCARCSTLNDADAKFCKGCGAKL